MIIKNMRTNNSKTTASSYNNCFVVGGKCKNKKGKLIKVPILIDSSGFPVRLSGGKDGRFRRYYEMSYEQVCKAIERCMKAYEGSKGIDTLRVSLYLDNAKYGDLHIFVIDFDDFDENSEFFQRAKELADKVTRSQGGGYHMFYGVDKEVAAPMFDSISLLASNHAKSFVCSTGNVSLDGANKVDFFCDARHFIYEWEPWDNTVGVTDKTQSLFELIRDNFSLKRPMDVGQHKTRRKAGSGRAVLPDELDELDLLARMNEAQKQIFDDLISMSPNCTRQEWFSIGLNVWQVFGDDLGRDVFHFWSMPGESYNVSGCALTWENIMERGPETRLYNYMWDAILHENQPSAF